MWLDGLVARGVAIEFRDRPFAAVSPRGAVLERRRGFLDRRRRMSSETDLVRRRCRARSGSFALPSIDSGNGNESDSRADTAASDFSGVVPLPRVRDMFHEGRFFVSQSFTER
jgi:hypothetical protein